ncbi:MAG TPA: ornithine racemase Orr [Anaerolineales bacterium]|nr:ornithine racemase Orr [Anaerolineales bacterium]
MANSTHRKLAESRYPRLEISLDKIRHNAETLVSMCRRRGIRVAGVTKAFCGHAVIARAMVAGGIDVIADSRIENLKRLRDIKLPKMLLRLPMISQVSEVVEYADISLNSEIETIRALSAEASLQARTHQVVLMFDLGDLREGIIDQSEMLRAVVDTLQLERITLAGIGANLTCFGGVIPTQANLARLVELKGTIEQRFDIELDIVSGGNSSSLHLVEQEAMPVGINQLRLGEAIVLGRETAFGRQIMGTDADCFKLTAEIIEIKDKPSIPTGELGLDSYGNRPSFVDRGTRRRAICAIGKQDVVPESIVPEDGDIVILGASSDHLILDITQCKRAYHVGGLVSFKLTYAGILSCMTSEYVSKHFG